MVAVICQIAVEMGLCQNLVEVVTGLILSKIDTCRIVGILVLATSVSQNAVLVEEVHSIQNQNQRSQR